MNVIRGGGTTQLPNQSEERDLNLRHSALGIAIEWARSAGPEHSTRLKDVEFIEAADKIFRFLKNGSVA